MIDLVSKLRSNGAPFTDPSFLPLLVETRIKMNLFCDNNQVDLIERFITSCEKGELENANQMINELSSIIPVNVRKELNIEKRIR